MAISKTQPMRPAEKELIDGYNQIIEDIPNLQSAVDTVVSEIGDENSGIVKDVNDLDSAVNELSSTVGNENNGLVKDVADLDSAVNGLTSTVGNENSGLIKDVDDLNDNVFTIQSILGDETQGLVKDVDDLKSNSVIFNAALAVIECGTADVSDVPANSSKNVTVTLNNSFPHSPCVLLQRRGIGSAAYSYEYATTDIHLNTFDIKVINNSSNPISVRIDWLAIGVNQH